MERNSLNEALKKKKAREAAEHAKKDDGHVALDDAKRVKVLSPGQLVFKRFIRNKLAIFGSCILILMFLFSFLCPIFYPYSQTNIFYKFEYTNSDYATANIRTSYTNYTLDPSVEVDGWVSRNITASIHDVEEAGAEATLMTSEDGKQTYVLYRLGDKIYTLSTNNGRHVASIGTDLEIGNYDTLIRKVEYFGEDMGPAFADTVTAAAEAGESEFTFEGASYALSEGEKKGYLIKRVGESITYTGQNLGEQFEQLLRQHIESENALFTVGDQRYILRRSRTGFEAVELNPGNAILLSSVYVFNGIDSKIRIPQQTQIDMLMNAYSGKPFQSGGKTYTIRPNGPDLEVSEDGKPIGTLTDFVARDAAGRDSLSADFKAKAREKITDMAEASLNSGSFQYPFEKMQTHFEGINPVLEPVKNSDGSPAMQDTTVNVNLKAGSYVLSCNQWRHLIDISGGPSSRHWFGTDTDGMDILARMMYGGRISLLVGFVVVILETLLGVIMGGIAGYFGGWVDNLIMRLVDIFYCIPATPILIIMGAFMEAMKIGPYVRLMYMMAVLGILGWASVARLVRGQILSLREQEFMVATEATGMKVRRRIFRHLLPNVMPQLIVSATAGLGSVILTESTLSFLGLGVKHPLATWGTMINSVTSSNENLIKYTYIWIPVGLLICLTVIAFNFVGDGLRDAFDPKMKR